MIITNAIHVQKIVLLVSIILIFVQVVIKLMNICKIIYVQMRVVQSELFQIKLLKDVILAYKAVKNVKKTISKNVLVVNLDNF